MGFFLLFLCLSISAPTNDIQDNSSPLNTFSASDFMGESPMVSQGVENWDMEEADSNGLPSGDWDERMYTYARGNLSDTAEVHGGSYSASLLIESSPVSDYISIAHYPGASDYYLTSDVNFTTWIYMEHGDSEAPTYFVFYFENATGYDFYMYYFLEPITSWTPTNTTGSTYGYAYFNVSDIPQQGQWRRLSRNITADFISVFGAFDLSIRYVFLNAYIEYHSHSGSYTNYYFDDFYMHNATIEFITNGDFEANPVTNWYVNNGNRDHSFITLSSVKTQGQYSANLTSKALTNQSSSRCELYDYIWNYYQREYVTIESYPIIEFDWYLDFEGLGDDFDQRAYFQIRLQDLQTSQYYTLYYFFGAGSSGDMAANSSYNLYLKAPSYNQTNEWAHFSMDMYSVLFSYGWSNLSIYEYTFHVQANYLEGARMTLLIDNYNLNVHPTIDPGFEVHLTDFHEFDSWRATPSGTPSANWTQDAHSGSYAANLTSTAAYTYTYLRRSVYLEITPSLTTDFYWRLDRLVDPGSATADSYIRLEFNDGSDIYYWLAGINPPSEGWNSTSDLYYLVDGMNEVGSEWKHLTRNIADDVQGFSQTPLFITEIYLVATIWDGGEVSTLFDDMHFVVDQTPPDLSNVVAPPPPNYLTSPSVTAEAEDAFTGVGSVLLHYNSGSGWVSIPMVEEATLWAGQIPVHPYGTSVDYYVEALDRVGNSAIDDNGGLYYSYTVIDDIDPVIGFDDPIWYAPASGILKVNASAEDSGSGIAYLELYIDAVLIVNYTSSPYQYEWDTRTEDNGLHALRIHSKDVGGNEVNVEIEVETLNDFEGPAISGVHANPESPVFDQATVVTAVIVDDSALLNVTLFYDVGSGWVSVPMEASGIVYSAVIPELPWNTDVTYYIVAYDSFEQRSPYMDALDYVVGDPYAPSISVSGPPVTESLVGLVQFSVFGEDEGSGVASVQVFVDGVSVDTDSSVPYSYSWDTTAITNGNYTLRFEVRDGAGNIAYSEFEYAVANPVGLDIISSTLDSMLRDYGFILGASTVIIAYVALKLLLRRRAAASK